MRTRKAMLPDASAIEALIAAYSRNDILLPRSHAEICENIRDFSVVERDHKIIACGALHLYGPHLAEVRSISVDTAHQRCGAGQRVIKALLAEASRHKVTCVCLFTRIPDYFARFAFSVTHRDAIPDKLYKDCLHCPKLHACDEVAMVRGELPQFALPEPVRTVRIPLVQLPAQ